MQKKIFALVLALAMVFSLCACGQSVGETASTSAAGSEAEASASAAEAVSAAEGAMKVGFVYIGDESEAYTANFIAAENAIAETYGDKVECIAKIGRAHV